MATATEETVAGKQPSNPGPSRDKISGSSYVSHSVVLERQMERVQKLPDHKRWPFSYGPLVLSMNAGLVGVISNSFFRRMLMVRKGLFLTSIPSALMPALIMTPTWMKFITQPVLLGELNCEVCANIRGGVINFVLGAVYPVILAAPISAALAQRYDTVKVPTVSFKNFDQRKFVDFWKGKIRYFKGQFITIAIFQTLFGMFVAGTQITVAKKDLGYGFVKVDDH